MDRISVAGLRLIPAHDQPALRAHHAASPVDRLGLLHGGMMPILRASVYANRFRYLSERFRASLAKTPKGKATESVDLVIAAGELFLGAVNAGYLHSLKDAKEIVDEYAKTNEYRYVGSQTVWSTVGKCLVMRRNFTAVRQRSQAVLFACVAGVDLFELANMKSKHDATLTISPRGLLPDAARPFFSASIHRAFLIDSEGEEFADLARLAVAEVQDRFAVACNVLGELLDAETTAAIQEHAPAGYENPIVNADANTPAKGGERRYLTKELAAEAGISTRTLGKYAEIAGVRRAGRGERNFEFTETERLTILEALSEKGGDASIREESHVTSE